jgi:TolA-binding protein
LQSLTQVVCFQLLTLSFGAQCLEENQFHDAITCLNRLWPRERLLEHQQSQLESWKQRRELLRKEGARREALVFQIDGIIARIERELEQFTKIESYDAALKLRLAQAFMGLERWREAGMILDEAVTSLEPDKTVEQAAITAIDCWQQTGDNARVIAAADRYLNIYGDHRRGDHVPDAIFAKGEGLRGEGRQQEAEKEFGDIANEWPLHPIAPRAMLMGGICQLERGQSDFALITFEALRKRFKKGPLHEDAMFWEGMALSIERRYDAALERLAASLAAYPKGRYAPAAEFERARCLHNQTKHREAAGEFRAWLKKYPEDRQENEARLLLAESLMADGEMDDGMAMLEKIPAADTKLWEEAQFKKGEALRKIGNLEKVREHYETFIKEQPRSRRLAEAAMWQARAVQRLGQPDAARALLWSTLEKLGDDPANEGVEDLLAGLPKLYRGPDEMRHLTNELEQRTSAARKANRKTLALRLTWAHANAVRAASPGEAQNLCFGLADLIDPAVHHPRIISDCADAQRDVKGFVRAKQLYSDLRKWHPRALEKERSSFGLGMIALAANEDDEAMKWFDRCIAESITGASGNDARLEKAALLRRRKKPAEAIAVLERVTANRLATSAQKARALLALGHCIMDTGDLKRAATHFERCYLSGAKYKDTAAEARLQHGLLLEKLHGKAAALTAYRELLEKKDLAFLPPAQQARARITALEGGAP